MNNRPIAIISHPHCLLHDTGVGHPECADRVRVIEEGLRNSDIASFLQFHKAKAATFSQLIKVHNPNYVKDLFEKSPKTGLLHLDPDTIMSPFTLQAALLAAGAAIQAVDLVMQTEIKQVFCNIRPPGHHAERNRAMGFCFFNNIAVGIAHALEQYSLKKVAIIDFDVHHGNGTENIFQQENRVFLCSSYQHPFYPFNVITENNLHTSHIPLSAGSTGAVFREKVEKMWLPTLREFSPECLFISAGFDAHTHDPLAGLNLNEEDYFWVTQQLLSIANEFCQGRLISVLEGGYALQALKHSVITHIRALIEQII